jgi:heme exporter protein C
MKLLYKTGTVVLLLYALVWGLLSPVPQVGDLGQTARNLFYHVPQWFSMYLMMALSAWYSLRWLAKPDEHWDRCAHTYAQTGVLFGFLGLLTGSVWSRVTWGRLMPDTNPAAWWSWDPKQTFALAAVLVDLAYLQLRTSIEDPTRRARLAAVYNLFAAASLIPLTLIIPRILGGLHPGGSDGSPVFNKEDISNEFRLIFYPAIIGFMGLGLWVSELGIRVKRLQAAAAQPDDTPTPTRKIVIETR